MFPLGIELKPVDPLAVRIGKRFNHPSDLFTFGLGIHWENISFDAAFVPTSIEGDLATKWLMGLRYSIPHKRHPGKHSIPDSVVVADTLIVHPSEAAPPADTTFLPAQSADSTAAVLPAPSIDSLIPEATDSTAKKSVDSLFTAPPADSSAGAIEKPAPNDVPPDTTGQLHRGSITPEAPDSIARNAVPEIPSGTGLPVKLPSENSTVHHPDSIKNLPDGN
jgi:hypothetical protein